LPFPIPNTYPSHEFLGFWVKRIDFALDEVSQFNRLYEFYWY
jgi:hypothetical protein